MAAAILSAFPFGTTPVTPSTAYSRVANPSSTPPRDQASADKERVAAILERFPLVYVEMDPGDVLFFHCNLLHASAENTSDKPRWSMICCYNSARNNPYKESHHPRYTPLNKVPDSAILEAGLKRFADSTEDVAWLEDKKDQSARSLEHQAAKHS